MKIRIDEAKKCDKSFIIEANKEIDKCSFIEKSKLSQNIEEDLFNQKKCVCLIAKSGRKRVGMILFSKVYWADRGEGIYISQVYVQEDFRKKGVFKKLMFKALTFYGTTNFLTCLVAERNLPMVSCMTKLDFEDEGMIAYTKNKDEFVKLF